MAKWQRLHECHKDTEKGRRGGKREKQKLGKRGGAATSIGQNQGPCFDVFECPFFSFFPNFTQPSSLGIWPCGICNMNKTPANTNL
jgi:hypothetical protein